MTIMTDNRPTYNYDADDKTVDCTVKALDAIARSRRSPKTVRIHAAELRDTAAYYHRVGDTGPWIKDAYARYVVRGSITAALICGLLPLLALSETHPFVGVMLFIGVGWGVYAGTYWLRVRRVVRSRKLPKA